MSLSRGCGELHLSLRRCDDETVLVDSSRHRIGIEYRLNRFDIRYVIKSATISPAGLDHVPLFALDSLTPVPPGSLSLQ